MLVYCHLSGSNTFVFTVTFVNTGCANHYGKIKRNYKNPIPRNYLFYVSEGSTGHLEKSRCISAHLWEDPVLRSPHNVHTAVSQHS